MVDILMEWNRDRTVGAKIIDLQNYHLIMGVQHLCLSVRCRSLIWL